MEESKAMPVWLQIIAYAVSLTDFIIDIFITITVKVSRSFAEGKFIKPFIAKVVGIVHYQIRR